MTESDPQTRAALLELAALDVCGLLDEYERSRFDREFHDAPETVREDIMRLQAELASETSLLPADEPEASLRARVLEAVSRAVDVETSRLAPLATIGRARQAQDAQEHRRWPYSTAALWRAAAFALAAASIVMGYMLSGAYKDANRILELALDKQYSDRFTDLVGPAAFAFIENQKCERLVFEPPVGTYHGTATVYIDTEANRVCLITQGLPEFEDMDGAEYTLRAVDADGDELEKRRFTRRHSAGALIFDVDDAADLVACRWEIIDPDGKTVVLVA